MTRARRTTIAIVGTVALSAGVLASCGGDDTVSADEYIGSVCTAIGDFSSTIVEGGTALATAATTADPEEGKEEITSFLSDATSAAEDAASGIEDAGVPDVENGEEIADALTGAFDNVASAFSDAEGEAEDLPTDSPESFQAASQELGTSIQEDGAEIQSGLEELGSSPELEEAAQDNEDCQSIEGGLAPPAATGATGL